MTTSQEAPVIAPDTDDHDVTECTVPLAPCPAWCSLAPGHGWDGYTEDGSKPEHWRRGHQGPHFGKWVSTDGEEHAHEPGVVTLQVGVDSDLDEKIVTPEDAIELAAALVNGAAWAREYQQ